MVKKLDTSNLFYDDYFGPSSSKSLPAKKHTQIISAKNPEIPHVYMAGKMDAAVGGSWRQGWRPEELPDLASFGYLGELGFSTLIKTKHGEFCYTGPYGDAMQNHSPLHGLDSAAFSDEKHILHRSLMGITKADFVIAVLDIRQTCYGAIAEIGFAVGLGVPVWIVRQVPDSRKQEQAEGCLFVDDLWFVKEMGVHVLEVPVSQTKEAVERLLLEGRNDWAICRSVEGSA